MIQERSDEQVLWERRKFTVSERALEPLNLSYKDMIEFIARDCKSVEWIGSAWEVVTDDGRCIQKGDFDSAIGFAAARYKEANYDIL